MFKMNKCYEIISPESASNGDFEETGFCYQDKIFDSLDEIVSELKDAGYLEPSSSIPHKGIWYTTIDPDLDYKTGNETRYSFHPKLNEEETETLHKLLKETRYIV